MAAAAEPAYSGVPRARRRRLEREIRRELRETARAAAKSHEPVWAQIADAGVGCQVCGRTADEPDDDRCTGRRIVTTEADVEQLLADTCQRIAQGQG